MTKTNNKGFSLVELIIVIAIMAILIGVLAPQYIKYVEKSRVSSDQDLIDSLEKAIQTAVSDDEYYADIASGNKVIINKTKVDISLAGKGITAALGEYYGTIGTDKKFKSKEYTDATCTLEIVTSASKVGGTSVLQVKKSVSGAKTQSNNITTGGGTGGGTNP